jgi:hypothetical protein
VFERLSELRRPAREIDDRQRALDSRTMSSSPGARKIAAETRI